jgi:bifunctional non-homologous end joining protein LigD
MTTLTIGAHEIELTSPDKLLWPEAEVTKSDLADLTLRLARHQLPHVRDRPATLVRCPDGVDEDCWYQKAAADDVPGWVRTATLDGWQEDGPTHVVVDEPATLAVLAQLAVTELHVGPCPVDDLDHPAEVVIDLDPPGRADTAVRAATRRVHDLLGDELGLTTFVKTTGSSGFHVHVPLDGSADVAAARGFARDAARLLAERHPEDLTTEQRTADRGDRVFVDWLRNHPTQTSIAPYSTRRRPGATVATPLDWDELSDGVAPDEYTTTSVVRRLAQRDDPWADLRAAAQPLDDAVARLDELA